MKASVKVEGIKELQQHLGRVASMRYLQSALKTAGEHVKTKAGKRPPESAANIPQPTVPGAKWYIRQKGQRWANVGKRGGSFKNTSEKLLDKWYVKTKKLSVTVGNLASYAHAVHGEVQALFHQRQGWKKLEATFEQELPTVVSFLQRAVNREVDKK